MHEHKWEPFEGVCCTHVKCSVCGVIKKIDICFFHKLLVNSYLDRAYFKRGDEFFSSDDIPNNRTHMQEFDAACEQLKLATKLQYGCQVLEVGMGIGNLVPWFLKNQINYTGIDFNRWACNYVHDCFGVKTIWADFLKYPFSTWFGWILALHTLEHLEDPEKCLEKMISLASYGVLVLIPNGSDLYNPDHMHFWNEKCIRSWFEELGLKNVESYIMPMPKEDYIWIKGEK